MDPSEVQFTSHLTVRGITPVFTAGVGIKIERTKFPQLLWRSEYAESKRVV